jgi:hypothetical protein
VASNHRISQRSSVFWMRWAFGLKLLSGVDNTQGQPASPNEPCFGPKIRRGGAAQGYHKDLSLSRRASMLPWSRFYFGNDEVIFATCSVTFRHLERRACSAAIASRSSVRAITASVGALVGKLLNR